MKHLDALGSILRGTANLINALDKVKDWSGKQVGTVLSLGAGTALIGMGSWFAYEKWIKPLREKPKNLVEETTCVDQSKRNEILKLADGYRTQKEIAEIVGCSEAYVSKILKEGKKKQK